jgi:hypothetical protein
MLNICFKAEALAIEKDTIVYVGSRDGVNQFIGPQTQTIDVGDGLPLPTLFCFGLISFVFVLIVQCFRNGVAWISRCSCSSIGSSMG